MKLTTRGRYAVTAMLDLAMHANDGPVALAEISERQQISLSYLEQLFASLRKQELVISTRGPGGGYSLKAKVADVMVSDIIGAVNETVDATSCGGLQNCHNDSRCITHDLWAGLSTHIESFLSNISLGDLVEKKPLQPAPVRHFSKTPKSAVLADELHSASQ